MAVAVVAVFLKAGCLQDPPVSAYSGSLGGQVVISGPLRNASIIIDQLEPHTGEVYRRVGETTSDQEGRFSVPTELSWGLMRIRAAGGIFHDRATGATIQLDPTDEITSLAWLELVEVTDRILVSPVGDLVARRARVKLETLGDMTAAWKDASSHLGKHFGNVQDWSRLRMIDLDQPATSPTEEVRAAIVHVALSFLAQDVAAEASGSPQEINVFELMRRWASDLERMPTQGPDDPVEDLPVFDGNDGNDRRPGSGLQLGVCPPVEPTCQVPADACNMGHCRTKCDLYVGHPRALLAGAMTKVIRDNGPGGVNQTGLSIQDTLAVARAVADNVDPDLFGGACLETLDRTPPEVRWDEALSAPADAVVRGVIPMKAIAIDDVDPRVRVEILGHADVDGDPLNGVALVNVDTTGVADGPLTMTAKAVDLAGNSKTIERRIVVDNTPPQLTLSPASFFVDGTGTWWTASTAPVLTGTIADAHPASVQVIIGGAQVAGTISGGTWTATVPIAIDLAGANVTIRATDRAGSHAELIQRIRADVEAPGLSVQPSVVTDEANEPVSFTDTPASPGSHDLPVHTHIGPARDLSVAGSCPSFTKHSYLLAAAPPAYGQELPARNPIVYPLIVDDPGVGLQAGSARYRVGRRVGGTTTWILDWTSAGAGTPLGAGVTRFDVGIFSELVAGLASTEGIYDVELRATDRLSRTTTIARCFDLRLKAPPMNFNKPNPGGKPTRPQKYALDSLTLKGGSPFTEVAPRLLNDDASGASLLDQEFSNGTAETVFLAVAVVKPTTVTATRRFSEGFVLTKEEFVGTSCGEFDPGCEPVPPFDTSSPPPTTLGGSNGHPFPVKVFELEGGVPAAEIPCVAPCANTDTTFKFAIPPRPVGGAPPRRFLAMTMIDKVAALRPADAAAPLSPPYEEGSITRTHYAGSSTTYLISGKIYTPAVTVTGCLEYEMVDDEELGWIIVGCRVRGTFRRVRVLREASLVFGSPTESTYKTAPTAQLTPLQPSGSLGPVTATRDAVVVNNWFTNEDFSP